jgi:hypothetical protein
VPLETALDDVTGLTRPAFAPGHGDVNLSLVAPDGRVLSNVFVPRDARPTVADGHVVHRGDLLARRFMGWATPRRFSGIEALRGFLDARPERVERATVAPCDGTVERIEPRYIFLRSRDGRLRRVWRGRSRGRAPVVWEGGEVSAGDILDDGARSHHDLLVAWGEERLARHMIEELETDAAQRSLAIPRAYWSLVVRSMLGWRRVLAPFDTGLRRHQVLSRDALLRVQRETEARGGTPATTAPVLRGLASSARNRVAPR